jgi:hypothetical protein
VPLQHYIFNNTNRKDTDSAGNAEPIFQYLERSARIEAERVRELIEQWFANYPDQEKGELRRRLQTNDDKIFSSSFFELYLHELFRRLGCLIEIHPDRGISNTRFPDFRITEMEGKSYYLEAVSVDELYKDGVIGGNFIDEALDAINHLRSEKYFLHVRIKGIPSTPIPISSYKKSISKWLEELDYQKIKEDYKKGGISSLPKKVISHGNLDIELIPTPKSLPRETENLIGSQGFGFRRTNTKDAIRKAIKDKAGRYGKPDLPYVIAINVFSIVCDKEDIIDALFGTEERSIDFQSCNSEEMIFRRKGDGAWKKQKNTRVSGVLIVKSLGPWSVAYRDIWICLNPWANKSYDGRLLEFSAGIPQDNGIIQWKNGIHPRKLFGLFDGWPES